MDVVLRTHTDDPSLAFRRVRRLGPADGYECELHVRSAGFVLARSFWFEPSDLAACIDDLRIMDRDLAGAAELRTRYEDNFVRFDVSARGVVTVSGTATEYSALGQSLRFAFETDQTVLRPLAEDLAALARPVAT
ncbi:hypothetical protein [Roseisolibacter sp. H3M3-2]|uniref:WapI family immunity protein n=1 Tax=Roseisolibacter sp. H3M3-2 TaxID=3031323 RepID=UPI0023D98998|nr:hypothetical protein [Roseisolibacter sp. H3M3-2]MDF1501718.1 hypothetical protein [Roseisolibacter sp. H3M3-2]